MDKQFNQGMIAGTRRTWRWALFVTATTVCVWFAQASTLLAEGEATAAGNNAPKGMLGIIFSGGIVGVLLMLSLFALSIIAAFLVFDHLMTIRAKDLMPTGLHERVRSALQAGKIDEASQACRENPSLLSFVLLHGISELEFGWSSVEKALEDAMAEQSARLYRKIEYLSVIGNIAPMVGLLGTVTGMIIAFQEVATSQGGATAPQLAEGIYQALVTTVAGLIVAIPSLGAFAVFRNRVDQLVAEAAYMAQHVFAPLRKKGRSKSSSS